MNKFQKAGLAVAVASGMAVGAGNLWGPDVADFPSLQVRVPDVRDCWEEYQQANDENPCYKQAGWWYGYDYEGGSIQVHKGGAWIEFKDVSLSSPADGSSLIDHDALRVRITAKSKDGTAYGGAGFGFDYGAPKSARADITACKGYKIKYKSDGSVEFKLGHDESTYNDACAFQVILPAKSSATEASFEWSDFKLPDWCKTSPPAGKPVVPEGIPLSQAESVKIASPATTSTTPSVIEFELYEFGFIEDLICADGGGGSGSSPIISFKGAKDLNFSVAGRMVSMTVKANAIVQVINLQGAVVHAQTLTPANGSMNLSKLPTGVYMLHAPALGYVNKIMLK